MIDKKRILKLFIILLSICLVILIVIVYKKSLNEKEKTSGDTQEEINEKILNNVEVNELSDKTEIERMKSYISSFFKNIEYGRYEKAYGVLNSEFKSNYFKTCDEFKTYIKGKTSGMISIEYINYERIGDLYVFWVKISDPTKQKKSEGTEINIVVKENELNNFEMSFSVI